MADLFISYSRKDIAYARLLHKALSENDLDIWVDWQDIPPSTEWLQEVYSAIEAAHTFIFLLSDSSALSETCSLEIDHAKKNNKRIIPIVINDIEPSKVNPDLAAINWIFSRSNDELQPAIAALIKAIETDYEWVKAHTRLQVRALEWNCAGQDRSFLLQGTDLRQAEDWLAEAPGKDPEPSLLQTRYIHFSRKATSRRQRNLLTGVAAALVVTVVLAVLAVINSQRAEQNAINLATQVAISNEQRGIAEEQREIAEEQKEVAIEQARLAHIRELTAVSQLPGTRFDIALLVGAEAFNSVDNYLTRSNLLRLTQQHPNVIRLITHEGINELMLSPDGKMLAAKGDDETLLLDINTITILEEQQYWVNSQAFSSDGRILAFLEENNTITIRDSTNMQPIGQPLKGFFNAGEGGPSIAFSPDSKLLAYAGSEASDKSLTLWNIVTGQKIGEIDEHINIIHSLAFSPDGKYLAIAGEDSRIIFWDLREFRSSLVIEREEMPGILSIAYSPDGKTLAAASRNRTIKLYDTSTGQQVGEPLYGHSGEVTAIVYNLSGDILVSSSKDGTIIFWDLIGKRVTSESILGEFAYPGYRRLTFSPDAKTLATTVNDEIILWDVASKLPINKILNIHDGEISDVAFSKDEKTLVSAGSDGSLIMWDTASAQPKQRPWNAGITDDSDFSMTHLKVDIDGKILAHVSGYENRIVTLWNMANGQKLRELMQVDNCRYFEALTFSPDGKILAVGGEPGTMIWDVATGKLIAWLGGHKGWVVSLAFSPDGELLVTGSDDSTMLMWDVANFQALGDPLREHQTPVIRLVFNSDGSLLASAGQDGAVILWDVASRMPLGEPLVADDQSGWREAIIAFTPDGRSLTTFHEDGVLSTWDVDVISWHHRICERVGRNFTQEEWDIYFPDEIYRKTCPQWPEGN